jgi:hypothetical protein
MNLLKELRSLPNPCDRVPAKRAPLQGSGAFLEGECCVCVRVYVRAVCEGDARVCLIR